MAYALKYTYEFRQIKNYTTDDWQIKIYKDGWGGGSTAIEDIASNTIQLDREGDFLTNVMGSKLTFAILNKTEGQYSEFRTASWGDYKVELIKNPNGTPNIVFTGYNQSEIYTEPYDQPPYESVLEFTCGLSHLKYVRFDNSGTLYEGQKSIIEILRLCLNKLPEPINIYEYNLIYEDSINSATTDSMLNQIYTDVSVYKEKEDDDDSDEVGFMCYRVIEEILKPFNLHIYHWNNIWQIWQPQGYQESTIYYRVFFPRVGSESTLTVDGTGSLTSNQRSVTGADPGNASELILLASDTDMENEPPLNRVKIDYDMTSLDVEQSNLIKNSCFEDRTTGAAPNYYQTPDFWTETGNDSSTYNAWYALHASTGDWFYCFDNTGDIQKDADSIDTGVYLSQTKNNIPTSTTDSLNFSFRWTLRANFGNQHNNFIHSTMAITWEVEIKFGTYYLSGDNKNGFSWTTTASRAKFIYDNFPSGQSGTFYSVTAYYFDENLPTLPQNSVVNFSIKFYRPYSNIPPYMTSSGGSWTYTALGQKCIKLTYLPNGQVPPVEQIIYSEINEDENVEEINVMHGDGLAINTLNSLRLSNQTLTDSWDRRGKTDNLGILNLLANQLRDLRGDYIRVLSGKMIGEIDIYNTITESYNGFFEYWISNYTYMIETNEFDVTLMELADHSLITTTIDEHTLIGNSGGNGTPIGELEEPLSPQSVQSPPSIINPNQSNLNDYPL